MDADAAPSVIVPRTVSVLCAANRSVYRELEGVEVYDKRRDARTFTGDTPIVSHPPCRSWSVMRKHQAKPEPDERELGLWCCEQLRACGEVLEQPAYSELFAAAKLPGPGERDGDLWSLAVWQAWWGYPMRKATWLAFCRIKMDSIDIPLRLHPRGGDRRAERRMSRQQRSATPRAFAEWLVAAARLAGQPDVR